MNILCTICARGGSKGVVGKNKRLINGIPLIAHTIKVAQQSNLFSNIVVSTEDDEIARIAEEYGAEILFKRPVNLASDKAAKLPVIRHAFTETENILNVEYDLLFDLDATSPLREVADVLNCYDMIKDNHFQNIITACESRRSPYFNLLELDENNVPTLSKPSDVVRRQSTPTCYDMNASIYVWTRRAILSNETLFTSDTGLYIMPESRSIDIDTELDFRIVKGLMENTI